MAFYGNNVGIIPLTDAGGITQEFKKGKHYGIDIGWSTKANNPYCKVIAWQDGVVVDGGYGSEVGNYLIVEHTYTTGKRWTGYIHLKDKPNLSVGAKVYFGQQMGNARRGSSGHSTAPHMHMYLTKIVSPAKKYSWGLMKENCIDPKPYLYYSKEFNTEYISTNSWKKALPAPVPEVVEPVARDTLKDQLTCHEEGLRVRSAPSLSAGKIGHLEKDKFYDYTEIKEAEGYKWYKLAENQWCAGIETLEVLPKEEPKQKYAIGDKVILNGLIYKSSMATSASGTIINRKTVVTRYAKGSLHPYNTTGDIGWCDESSLSPAPVEEYYTVAEGDTLQSVATKHNLTLEELINLNPSLIKAGQSLRVK